MSTVEIVVEGKGTNKEFKKGTIKDVVFAYTKLQDGAFTYGSKVDKEYTTDVILTEDQADDFEEAFPKNKVKQIKTDVFEDKYKFSPPYPKQKKQYVAKFKVGTKVTKDYPTHNLEKGVDDVPYTWPNRPKVFLPVEGGVQDVTMSTLIGNGSKGIVKFNITTHPTYGEFPKLTAMLVTELVPYEAKASASAGEFGEIIGGLNEGDGTTQQKAAYNAPTESEDESEEESSSSTEEVNFDDDAPFK